MKSALRVLILVLLALFAGSAEAQQRSTGPYIQVSPTPSKLSTGGPGFVQIDANGIASIATAIPGSGTVTNTSGALAIGSMVVGNSGADVKTVGGTIGGAFTTGGPITFSNGIVGVTFQFPVGGPFNYILPGASQTLASLAGSETFTNKIYSGGQLSGTFTGNPVFGGVPSFTGLSPGVQTRCLGLDVGNNLVTLNAGCGSGGGGSAWTLTDGTHTVASVTQVTVTGGTVGGSTPNATLTIAAGGTVTQNGNLATNQIAVGGTNGTTDIKTVTTGANVLTALSANVGSAGAFAKNNGDALSGTYTGAPTFSGNVVFSGIPKFTGLSGGTAVACLALDGVNSTIAITCTSGGSGTVNVGGANQLAYYSALGSAVSGNSHLSETGTSFITNYNSGALPAPMTGGAVVQVGAADGSGTRILEDSFGTGGGSALAMRLARGTNASKTAVQLNDVIGSVTGWGFGATAYSTNNRVHMVFSPAENWTDTAQGTKILFGTTPNTTATTSDKVLIDNDGGVVASADVAGSPPTGGSKGAGSINISGGYYVNNVAVNPVSVTSTTPNIIVTPTPGTGTFSVGSTSPINDISGSGTAIVTGDNTKIDKLGAFTYTLAQAGSAGFLNGWGVCLLNVGASNATINTTTSTFIGAGGSTSLVLAPSAWACPTSDGTNYQTPEGNNIVAGTNATVTRNTNGTTTIASTATGGLTCPAGFTDDTLGHCAWVQTVSAVSTVDFTGLTINDYTLVLDNVVQSAGTDDLLLRFAAATSSYVSAYFYNASTATTMTTSGASPATNGITIPAGTTAGSGGVLATNLNIHDLRSGAANKSAQGTFWLKGGGGSIIGTLGGEYTGATTDVTAIHIVPTGSTTITGTITLIAGAR